MIRADRNEFFVLLLISNAAILHTTRIWARLKLATVCRICYSMTGRAPTFCCCLKVALTSSPLCLQMLAADGMPLDTTANRQAALAKFRAKRKARSFEKKVCPAPLQPVRCCGLTISH